MGWLSIFYIERSILEYIIEIDVKLLKQLLLDEFLLLGKIII